MQVGDIVKIGDWKGSQPDGRKCGKVLRIDGRHRWSKIDLSTHRTGSIAEVMWQDGYVGWVLTARLEKSTA
jgi:hypothetical protein